MTNPRDDLMALADRLRELVFRQGQIDWDALIKIEIDLRLAASRSEPVDREAVARAVADRPWEEDYPLGSIGAFNAKGRKERDLAKADAIISLLRPAEPVEAEEAGWTYETQHGPDGEAAYAWVYDKEHFLVCTVKIHHAKSIVDRMNAAASKSPDIVELLKLAYDNMFDGEAREQIRRKLFE